MNAFFQPESFYSILNPIFYFSKIFGLAPFSINSTFYKKSIGNTAWCVILLIIYVTIFIVFDDEPILNSGFITALTGQIDYYISQFGMWFAIILSIYFAKDLNAAVAEINKLDGEIQKIFKINLKEEYRTNLSVILKTIMVVFTFFVLYTFNAFLVDSVIGDIKDATMIVNYIECLGPSLTNTIVALQFSLITWCLKRRFLLINSRVGNIFNKLHKSSVASYTKIMPSDLLQDRVINIFENVREKHTELCNVCVNINKCYSFQILLLVIQDFITIILSMNFGGRNLFDKQAISVGFVMFCGNQIFLAIMQVVILVLICSSTVAEARRTGDLIHNTLTSIEPCKKEMYLQASYFSLQLLHNNFNFTASGVVTIGPSLLLEIVGAVCTYLVIVVQFEISYPNPNW